MKRPLLLFLCLFTFFYTTAATDTLRHYDAGSRYQANMRVPASNTAYIAFIARFEPLRPGHIKAISLGLDGPAGSSAKVHLYGHDGGTSFPQLEEEIMGAVTVTKKQNGFEMVALQLDEPVLVSNNQFFVYVDELKGGARMVFENKARAPSCNSSDGGIYRYLYYKRSDPNPPYYPHSWQAGGAAFIVDVAIDYKEAAAPLFRDVTHEMGIDTNLGSRSIAWADVNGDRYPDLLVAGKLYMNKAGKNFEDVTSKVGLQGTPGANAIIDMDNDGDADLLFLGMNEGGVFKSRLYLQQQDGSFLPTELNLPELKAVSGFAVADINKDNYPDLFICQLWRSYPDPEPNYYFENNKQNGFTDRSDLFYASNNNQRRSRGCRWVDYDNGGHLDLYVTNYFLETDELYHNNGDGTFSDVIAAKNIDRNQTGSNHGTGCDWADYDNDGDMDLLLPQFAHPWGIQKYDHRGTTIYRNTGAPDYNFEDMKESAGIEYEETHAGAAWGDWNNDGLTDFAITTYYGCRYMDIYMQNKDHSFALKTYEAGMSDVVTGEDAVWVDFNNDGLLDLACGKRNRIRLWLHEKAENSNNWSQIDLEPANGNSMAAGARVVAWYNGKPHMKDVHIGHGQRMQDPLRLHYGLGQAGRIDSVTVYWPGGQTDRYNGLQPNRLYTLKEGGEADPPLLQFDKDNPLMVTPNPASGSVQIIYKLDQAAQVAVEIIDPAGKVVLSQEVGMQPEGTHTLTWNGDNASHSNTPLLYMVRLKTGDQTWVRKLIYRP